MDLKTCSKCGKALPLSNFRFGKSKRYKKGGCYRGDCRECENSRQLEYFHNNADECRKKVRQWGKLNRQKKTEYMRKLRKTNHSYRINTSISRDIRDSINGCRAKRHHRLEKLLGYSISELMRHIEKQFKAGMTWENYGEWHIDHKIPRSAFNFTKVEQLDFRRCWALDNLQPLWRYDNLSKSKSINETFQPSFQL